MTSAGPSTETGVSSPQEAAGLASRMTRSLKWTGPGRVTGRALQFVFQIVLGRALGPAGFGLYTLGFTVIDVLKQFSLLGLQNGVVRFGSIHIEDRDWVGLRRCFAVSHFTVLGGGIGIATILWLSADHVAAAWLRQPDVAQPLRLFAVALPFYAWLILSQYWAWTLKRVDLDVLLADLVQPALAIAFTVAALHFGLGLSFLVLAYAASCAIAAIASLLLLRRVLAAFPPGEDRGYSARSLFRVSVPILFVGFTYILMGHIDKLMLAYYRDPAAVGTYTAAFRLSRQMAVIQGMMAPVFAPLVASLSHTRNTDDLRNLYRLATRWMLLVSLPVVLVTTLFGDVLLGLFGEGFRSAWIVLVVLAVGRLVNLGGGVAMQLLQMTGGQDSDLKIIVSGLVMNVGLNVVLIARYGELGAAIATAISFSAISFFRIWAVRETHGMWPLSTPCWKLAAAAVVVGSLTAAARPFLPGGTGTSVALLLAVPPAYGAAVLALGLAAEDRAVAVRVAARLGFRRGTGA